METDPPVSSSEEPAEVLVRQRVCQQIAYLAVIVLEVHDVSAASNVHVAVACVHVTDPSVAPPGRIAAAVRNLVRQIRIAAIRRCP